MRSRIIRIGKSHGIKIAKPLLDKAELQDAVEIRVTNGELRIRPARRPRSGWAAAFKRMAEQRDDAMLDGSPPSLTGWDEDEWEWK